MPFYPTADGFFSTDHRMTTCGSDAGITESEILSFGFTARGLRIYNVCTDPLHVNLNACAATTLMGYIAGCHEVVLTDILTAGIGLKTTSTSTTGGLPTARPRVEIHAWSA